MRGLAALAVAGLASSPGRTVVRTLTLAAAVALLGAMLLFVGHSLRTMTGSAVRTVPLDWQGPVSSYRAAVRAAAGARRQDGVLEAVPAATAPFAGVEHRVPIGRIRSGAGSILAVPASYLDHIRTFRMLRGALRPGAVVLDQQLAATLQVEPGDTVFLTERPGRGAQMFRVSGIASSTASDLVFQPLNPLLGPAPAQPPANIAIMPLATFARRIAGEVPAITPARPGSALPGAQTGIQWQVDAQVDPATLNGSPAVALRRATQIRNAAERNLPGQVQFVDNLADGLNTAAGDALYAETLFIMLAVPGALVALALAYLAALGTVEQDRRNLALLRARGASRRHLILHALFESAAIGLAAGVIGTAGALVAIKVAGSAGGVDAGRVRATLGVCVALAIAGALAARLVSGLSVYRSGIGDAHRGIAPRTQPLWQRLYLDLIALALAGLLYWLTARTGFTAVVNPDSNPTLSLSVYMFFAPALLWLGATLLVIRLRGRGIAWLATRATDGRATSWRGFLLTSAGRRGSAINRGLLIVGLLLAFGVDLAIFSATYDQQARIDAQLTLGADVVVSAPTGVIASHRLAQRVDKTAGVAGTTGVDHTYAYVGPDLQDTFGVDPATLRNGSTLRDSYFIGGGTSAMLDRLRATRDGVLVSTETIRDYSLSVNDLLKLRVLDRATGRFRVVPFHVVGAVQEFPSAPRDSFMVTNLSYLQRVTHDRGPNVLFVRAAGDPVALAHQLAADTRRDGTSVKNIRQQEAQTVSSITTVDLAGISKIEEAFVIALVAAAMALFVTVALVERRNELATMAALGASLRQVASFIWSEALLVLAAGIALAGVLGWLLAQMLVAMLRHVFDPPPEHLAAPWGYLGGLAGAAITGALVATAIATAGIRRLRLGAILREE